jgi:hypothetical protein
MPARERAYEIMTMHVHARCSRQSGKRWIFQNLTIRPLKLKAITNKVELGYAKRARAWALTGMPAQSRCFRWILDGSSLRTQPQ